MDVSLITNVKLMSTFPSKRAVEILMLEVFTWLVIKLMHENGNQLTNTIELNILKFSLILFQ